MILDEVIRSTNKGKTSRVYYVDSSKAFDSVSHLLVDHKLPDFGITKSARQCGDNFSEIAVLDFGRITTDLNPKMPLADCRSAPCLGPFCSFNLQVSWDRKRLTSALSLQIISRHQ